MQSSLFREMAEKSRAEGRTEGLVKGLVKGRTEGLRASRDVCAAMVKMYHSSLEPLGLTQVDAARELGMSVNRLNELVLGKRGVTAERRDCFARTNGRARNDPWTG